MVKNMVSGHLLEPSLSVVVGTHLIQKKFGSYGFLAYEGRINDGAFSTNKFDTCQVS